MKPDYLTIVSTILMLIALTLHTFPCLIGIGPSILSVMGWILGNFSMLLLLFAPGVLFIPGNQDTIAQDTSAKLDDPLRVAVVMLLLMVFTPYVLLCLMGLTVPLFVGIIVVVSEILAILMYLFTLGALSDPSDQSAVDQDTTEE